MEFAPSIAAEDMARRMVAMIPDTTPTVAKRIISRTRESAHALMPNIRVQVPSSVQRYFENICFAQ